MSKRRLFPVLFFGLLAAAILGHSGAVLVIWLIVAAGYGVSLVIHPRARCLHCSGTGELRGALFSWTFRKCPKCAGGRIVRWGAAGAGLPHVREQARAQKQARENAKTRERW